MSKELFISSSPHETKIAMLEGGELVEVYYQRDTDEGLAGGIYKGRVSRVLPGMQSAFVDIGLGRDAFLYVSDFFEESDEYERVLTEADARAEQTGNEPGSAPELARGAPADRPSGPAEARVESQVVAHGDAAARAAGGELESSASPPGSAFAGEAPPLRNAEGRFEHRHDPRGHRRRRRSRHGFVESGFRGRRPEPRPSSLQSGPSHEFQILPGESLAKYGHLAQMEQAAKAEPEPVDSASAEGPAGPAAAGIAGNLRPEDSSLPVGPPDLAEKGPSAEPQNPQRIDHDDLGPEKGAAPPFGDTPKELEAGETALPDEGWRVARLGFEPDAPVSGSVELQEGERATSVGSESPTSSMEVPGERGGSDHAEAAREPVGAVVLPSSDQGSQPRPAEPEGAGEQTPDTPRKSEDRSYSWRDTPEGARIAPRRGRRLRGRFGHRGVRPSDYRHAPLRPGNNQPVEINALLREGQEILVQIAKQPLGSKGARITSHIALPGRYLVFMPTITHIGVSRKIGSEEERLRLRNLILDQRGTQGGGFIVRTAAAGRSEEELKADIRFLATLWADIRNRAERCKAPALIHRDLTLVERILRDLLSPDFKSIRVDNEVEYEHALEFVSRHQPSLVGQVRLYTNNTPLFESFGIQQEIDKALKPKVWLKSGGYIVVNQTEALVAIDVNTGKYVGRTNRLEDTIVKTNIDAVKEIVRQIRLRDLGGIIVIDFIDMDDRRNRQKVVQALEEALRADRAPTKILSFNEFGLIALTRKRVKQSLERTLCEPCAYCSGAGWIKSPATVCYEIAAEVRKMADQIEGKTVTLRVSPEVAKAFKARGGALVGELESITGKDIIIRSDPSVHQERFEIF